MGRRDQVVTRRAEAAVALGVLVVSVVVLGPALGPGYVLQNDLVFVPSQDLLPWMLGLGGALPRSVPQDAVVALLSGPVPGSVLEKLVLLGALVLLGTGTARLVRSRGVSAMGVAATTAVWSAYVGERLLLGHWSLLLAVGALPWALHHAVQARSACPGAGARWLLLTALASLTVTGGLVVLLATLPVVLSASRVAAARRVALTAGGLALQLPWLVPAVLHGGTVDGESSLVFAARAEGPWGLLLTLLSGGGAWNSSAVPATRVTWWAPVAGLLVLAVAAAGARDVPRVLGRAAAWSLTVAAALGLGWCVLGGWGVTSPAAAWVVGHVPGAGVLRDAQKWLAPLTVLVAVAAGLGAVRLARALARRSGDRAAARVLVLGLALLPVAVLPDLAGGVLGRLSPVAYPDDLTRVRTALAAADDGRDAVSLPWDTFRRFPWNPGRTVLDPVPRAMPVTVVASDSLTVATGHGLVTVAGDDPRSARVSAARAAGQPLGPVLSGMGVGWAVVAADLPDATADLPDTAVAVVRGTSFALYRLPGAGLPPRAAPGEVALVLGADAVACAVVLGAAVVTVRTRSRRRGAPGATGWYGSATGS